MSKTKQRIVAFLLIFVMVAGVGGCPMKVEAATSSTMKEEQTSANTQEALSAKAKTYGEYTQTGFINAGFDSIPKEWNVWFIKHCADQVEAGRIFSSATVASTFYEEMTNPDGEYKAKGVYFDEGRITDFSCYKYASAVDRSSYVPQVGDIICLNWNDEDDTSVEHMGIVTGYDASAKKIAFVDGCVRSTEAEKLRVMVRDGDSYDMFTLSNKYIVGYIRPDYAALVDTVKPTITDIQIEKDHTGYTISCKASDNVQIASVKFPTWTEYYGQDDLSKVWPVGTYNSTTDRWEYRVNLSKHYDESGVYNTHIYAYDTAGNFIFTEVEVEMYPLTDISLSSPGETINIGEQFKLDLAYNPSNTTDDTGIIWTSSNDKVATVSNGVVTAVSSGTAMIKATSQASDKITARCSVTVYKGFTDVASKDWYFTVVQYVYRNGIMEGTSDTTFSPKSPLTRAQFVTVLHNMEGCPDVSYDPVFTDVGEGFWYTKPVYWAYKNGITSGIGNNLFGTNNNITREQLAVMLYEYSDRKGYNTSSRPEVMEGFEDVDEISTWAQEAIQWAVSQQIMGGKPNAANTGFILDPKGNATRAECAAMIRNLLD